MVLAVVTMLLYRRSQRQGGAMEEEQREVASTYLTYLLGGMALLTVSGVSGMLITGYSEFLCVIFLGICGIIPVQSYRETVIQGRERKTRWHSRRVTLKGCMLLLLVTYIMGLNVLFIACYGADVSLSNLSGLNMAQISIYILVHIFTSLGYAAQTWLHLSLVQTSGNNVNRGSNLLANNSTAELPNGGGAVMQVPGMIPAPTAPQEPSAPGYEEDVIVCTVCLDAPRDCILEPCRHQAVCYDCAVTLIESARPACPICRAELQDVIKVFIS